MDDNYHIFTNGRLKREDDTVVLDYDDGKKYIPVEKVNLICVHSQLDYNNRVFSFLNSNGIEVHIFDWNGRYSGSFMSEESVLSGESVVRQVEFYKDEKARSDLAREFVMGSMHNMKKRLKYHDNRHCDLEDEINGINNDMISLKNESDINSVMGLEASARKKYYNVFDKATPDDFSFSGRKYNPPNNEINSLISFGNSLLYSVLSSCVNETSLHPCVSFLHEPGNRRRSLCLDVSDVFKPVLVDRIIFRLLNRKQITIDDFEMVGGCKISEDARKEFVLEFEEEMENTIKHKSLGRHVSYQRLLSLEFGKLRKHFMGDERYSSFKKWW
jgi:CRISPR-associated protein Cas1